jgi:nucleoid-associated protein YejK
LRLIRNVSESHLFNILFVKSCEVRRILPISSTQYLRLSLHEVIETIDAMNFDPDKDWDDYLRDFRFSLGKNLIGMDMRFLIDL